MSESYEHYISNNIRDIYKHRLIAPIIYLVFLVFIWILAGFSDILSPASLTGLGDLKQEYDKGGHIQTTLKDLYFTGYTNTMFGSTQGYYYYIVQDDRCYLVLLSPHTSEAGLPHIDQVHIKARILKQGNGYSQITEHLATDLSWTVSGLKHAVSIYVISEPDFGNGLGTVLILLYFATGIYALLTIALYVAYILHPALAPSCRRLAHFGKASELLAQAEKELATLPQLATEDMFITEHFFIAISKLGVALVPIQEILWIYKYSILHKFLWYHFHISYTLHIVANKRLHIRCPESIKSDIDGITDYLAEANHDILVGFSEENRLKVQAAEVARLPFETFWRLFMGGQKL